MKDNKFAKYKNELKTIQINTFFISTYKAQNTDFNNDRTATGLLNDILNGSGWIFIM